MCWSALIKYRRTQTNSTKEEFLLSSGSLPFLGCITYHVDYLEAVRVE